MSKVAKKNVKFVKLTPSAKRVAIATDVVASLKTGQLKAQFGTWAERQNPIKEYDETTRDFYKDEDTSKYEGTQLCDILSKTKCNCCALGGIFIEAVKRFNDLEARAWVEYGEIEEYLVKFFPLNQIKMIEYAFELGNGGIEVKEFDDAIEDNMNNGSFWTDYTSKTADKCEKFGGQFSSAKDRMVGIMENIIKNKGVFKP